MKTPARLVKTASVALAAMHHLPRRSVFLLILLLNLTVPRINSTEVLYFCSLPHPSTSGPWSIDVDVNGTPDLDVAVAGQNITILPAIGNSVLATNRSYYTNIPPLQEPVMVAVPNEVASLASGTAVSFFNLSNPFWREFREGNEQPLTLPMAFPSQGSAPTATNYFAIKVRRGAKLILAWVRVRLTSGNEATCALDWGYDTRQTPRLVDEIVIGSRPAPATILSMEKVIDLPLFDEALIDLDADGAPDVSFGGWAFSTFGGVELISGGTIPTIWPPTIWPPTIPPSSGTLSYGLGMAGQNEVLRDNRRNALILPSGGGIADFVPPGTFWAGDSAGLVSRGLGTNSMWVGPLAEVTNGYVGVRIYKDNDFYYGWIHLRLGPSILGWAMESRPQVPIIAGARGVGGEVVLTPPTLVANLAVVNVSGLSRSNIILSSSQDLFHWTPLITNSVPFNFVYPVSTPENARYFRAVVWADPPAPQPLGYWDFKGYSDRFAGTLVTTGLITLTNRLGLTEVSGTWTFEALPNGTNTWRLLCSSGEAWGGTGGNFRYSVFLGGCGFAEGAFFLDGTLLADTYSGTWYDEGFLANPIGTFIAKRKSK